MQKEQFLRITRLLGDEAIEALHTKKVAVVGLGAVGGMCLESLVRSGIGAVRLVDFDLISITNLNRQILATHQSIGQPKIEAAAQRVKAINPHCIVEQLPLFVDSETVSQIFEGDVDLVIDAIDSLNPKCALLEAAYRQNFPIVSSMGAALRRDPSLVRTGDLMDTYGCPLAKQVRSNLRKRGIGRGIEVVYSSEEVRFTYKNPEDEEMAEFNEQISDKGRRRNVLGSLPTITAIFGQNLAHLALERLMGEEVFFGTESRKPNKQNRKGKQKDLA
ncbi:MAG TPA: tRNA threonylcarbamoyladenosine dehydratase [Sphaerochaeta sp.]|nr:tRNA threonylcarbamoyladenosine dehydratase [Sphaerochaeta sp.]